MKKILGIELGSTRIKSILMDESASVIAQGSYEWENELVDGLWSYSLENIEKGLQTSYARLSDDYKKTFGNNLTAISAIGISAMMHGYLAFDEDGKLQFKTEALDADGMYDDIGSVLKIKQLQREKEELLESLEMYYRVFFLGETPDEELQKKADSEE